MQSMNKDMIDHPNPERHKIMMLYILFAAGLFGSFIPAVWPAIISLIVLILVLGAAYSMRHGKDDDSLLGNHATFLISTIWKGSTLAAITLAIGGVYLLQYIDQSPLTPCLDKIMEGAAAPGDMAGLKILFAPCFDVYYQKNSSVFIVSGLMAMGPPLAYFLIRLARGAERAMKGYRIAHPRAWF